MAAHNGLTIPEVDLIAERVVTELRCPGCNKKIDVTEDGPGMPVECPHCQNMTWRLRYPQVRWWNRTRNFLFSLTVSFFVGVLASVVGNMIVQRLPKAGEAETQTTIDASVEDPHENR